MADEQGGGGAGLGVLVAAIVVGGAVMYTRRLLRRSSSAPAPHRVTEAAPGAQSRAGSAASRKPKTWAERNGWVGRQAQLEASLSDADWLQQHEAMEHEGLRGDH